eukprot:gnl/Chilomastix_cuspidata/3939.p1 GENE.gnl/Chilomastix_cuspidata/3939~~gnl/Chilomastix_cuspidata/3939.p1  ORF type:complete len:1397 (+),score=265.07 gnl/Chilomastix_cuspidata/3939:157-4347(+)
MALEFLNPKYHVVKEPLAPPFFTTRIRRRRRGPPDLLVSFQNPKFGWGTGLKPEKFPPGSKIVTLQKKHELVTPQTSNTLIPIATRPDTGLIFDTKKAKFRFSGTVPSYFHAPAKSTKNSHRRKKTAAESESEPESEPFTVDSVHALDGAAAFVSGERASVFFLPTRTWIGLENPLALRATATALFQKGSLLVWASVHVSCHAGINEISVRLCLARFALPPRDDCDTRVTPFSSDTRTFQLLLPASKFSKDMMDLLPDINEIFSFELTPGPAGRLLLSATAQNGKSTHVLLHTLGIMPLPPPIVLALWQPRLLTTFLEDGSVLGVDQAGRLYGFSPFGQPLDVQFSRKDDALADTAYTASPAPIGLMALERVVFVVHKMRVTTFTFVPPTLPPELLPPALAARDPPALRGKTSAAEIDEAPQEDSKDLDAVNAFVEVEWDEVARVLCRSPSRVISNTSGVPYAELALGGPGLLSEAISTLFSTLNALPACANGDPRRVAAALLSMLSFPVLERCIYSSSAVRVDIRRVLKAPKRSRRGRSNRQDRTDNDDDIFADVAAHTPISALLLSCDTVETLASAVGISVMQFAKACSASSLAATISHLALRFGSNDACAGWDPSVPLTNLKVLPLPAVAHTCLHPAFTLFLHCARPVLLSADWSGRETREAAPFARQAPTAFARMCAALGWPLLPTISLVDHLVTRTRNLETAARAGIAALEAPGRTEPTEDMVDQVAATFGESARALSMCSVASSRVYDSDAALALWNCPDARVAQPPPRQSLTVIPAPEGRALAQTLVPHAATQESYKVMLKTALLRLFKPTPGEKLVPRTILEAMNDTADNGAPAEKYATVARALRHVQRENPAWARRSKLFSSLLRENFAPHAAEETFEDAAMPPSPSGSTPSQSEAKSQPDAGPQDESRGNIDFSPTADGERRSFFCSLINRNSSILDEFERPEPVVLRKKPVASQFSPIIPRKISLFKSESAHASPERRPSKPPRTVPPRRVALDSFSNETPAHDHTAEAALAKRIQDFSLDHSFPSQDRRASLRTSLEAASPVVARQPTVLDEVLTRGEFTRVLEQLTERIETAFQKPTRAEQKSSSQASAPPESYSSEPPAPPAPPVQPVPPRRPPELQFLKPLSAFSEHTPAPETRPRAPRSPHLLVTSAARRQFSESIPRPYTRPAPLPDPGRPSLFPDRYRPVFSRAAAPTTIHPSLFVHRRCSSMLASPHLHDREFGRNESFSDHNRSPSPTLTPSPGHHSGRTEPRASSHADASHPSQRRRRRHERRASKQLRHASRSEAAPPIPLPRRRSEVQLERVGSSTFVSIPSEANQVTQAEADKILRKHFPAQAAPRAAPDESAERTREHSSGSVLHMLQTVGRDAQSPELLDPLDSGLSFEQ